eukprot:CAMPEP_0202363852 /NCGR_PEP_ID=MMETSP1126-20121109/15479_1 /ASSEMBLY_ACC=CAM_ASM_000457 /TAXON_ID=3047 /ORGANISM="Dunaliella tertiolecta, Strain CCMP1320" /LENGTH=390 /DNA_ID=CAMNT_0048958347 /DNA_START=100 /DNA_END=1272 /DNA_ORIENTATION=-
MAAERGYFQIPNRQLDQQQQSGRGDARVSAVAAPYPPAPHPPASPAQSTHLEAPQRPRVPSQTETPPSPPPFRSSPIVPPPSPADMYLSRPPDNLQPRSLPPLMPSNDNEDYHPSDGWRLRQHHLQKDQLWERICEEARQDAMLEPRLATFLHSVVLSHKSVEAAFSFLMAAKLADNMMLGPVQILTIFREAYDDDPSILEAGLSDLQAVIDRDPACSKYSQCLLYFKGFQAVQCYRVTHWLWQRGRKALALAIHSRVCQLFDVDIHPGARIGRGVMLDHATGIVIGETAVVGENVSMLHHVSLGGSGTGRGVRHPNIGHGVLLGAGVIVLGPVSLGAGSKVGAGSVVVSDIPEHCVAVGVPAKIIKCSLKGEPVREMDQCTDFILDYVI